MLAVTLLVVIPMAIAQEDGDAASLLKKGLEQVRAGQLKDGIESLRAALAKDPTNEEIMGALGRAEYSALLGVLASGQEGVNVVTELLRRAMPVLPEKAFNMEELGRLVQTAATSEDGGERFEAAMTLARTYGEFAVPGLVEYLASTDTDHKINAHLALMNRIGRDAVLPLNEALQNPNAGVRRMVVAELGTIGDERSLAAVAEAVASETDEDAKAKASAAWNALAERYPGESGKSASDLYLQLATLYYQGEYRVTAYADKPLVVWTSRDGALRYNAVPRHLYMLKLAEEAAYDSLRTNPENQRAAALLARILLSEKLAADAVAAAGAEDEVAKKAADELSSVTGTVAALGWGTLSMALSDSLDSDDHGVSVALLGVMPWVYGSSDFTSDNPVVRATGSQAGAVRMAAAEAILRFNGVRQISGYPDAAGFVSLVGSSIGEVIPRQVLVIDGNDVRRNKVLTELNNAKYNAFDARTGRDGVVRAGQYVGLDLILIAGNLPDIEALGAIARLREDPRTKNVPIVLIADASQAADEKWTSVYQEKVNAIAAVPEGPGLPTEAFLQAVNGAFASPAPEAAMRYRVSAAVLDALASTEASNGIFQWGGLQETITALLKADLPADIPVKLNATRALGNIGDAGSIAALVEQFSGGADAAHRAAAGMAIVGICRRGEVSFEDAAFDALLRGTKDEDTGVRQAAFAALGAGRLSAAQAVRAAVETRPGERAAAPAPAEGGGDMPAEGCGCGS